MRLVLSSVSRQALAPGLAVLAISDKRHGYSVRFTVLDPNLKKKIFVANNFDVIYTYKFTRPDLSVNCYIIIFKLHLGKR